MKLLLLSLLACKLLAAPQDVPKVASRPEMAATVFFQVRVDERPEVKVTAEDLAKMQRHSVTVEEHGKQVQYDGVWLHDVLAGLGVPFGAALRGKALASYMLATGRDGYAVVYTLTEMDTAFSAGDLMLADKVNGKPLPETQGPLRIVAPHDKKPARSLRMLQRIDVVSLRK
ncbi:MAG TPA: molybdopterin-dependent oxidoreductase [Bryobacteraceae bacterium]|jgi:DMSO/TMAO reductase YedYZ molybdopterin-dependent catalytic subunit|nr:molybdopterin-dependent oxidoreductase [Bryobacteraceae bacterium]